MPVTNRRQFLGGAFGALARRQPPNVILILCDNLGYGDVGCYGATDLRTPHIDRLAREGMRFTSFYAASGVCTPSRASLMTGCYPRRVGLHLTDPDGIVLRPVSHNGLNPDEVTIAEVLKTRGYRTSIVGKWHLGDQLPFLPTRQGFDNYFGIPYSDDMAGGRKMPYQQQPWPPLPLMQDERVIEAPVDRNLLTRRYTERCVDLIRDHHRQPFFLYLAHAMPGSTTTPFASDAFRGKSRRGPWGDAVEEIDWSTGQILEAVRQQNLDGNTLIIWTNDNGAPRHNGRSGSNLPLGGWGYTTAEGGQRVPCIARWPGVIPANRACDAMASLMDWLPTLAAFSGAKPPRPVDGKNIEPLLKGRTTKSPHEAFYYYQGPQLQAVRSGKWKYFLPIAGEARLYDLDADLGETRNLHDSHPAVVRRLTKLAETARADLGDLGDTGRPGRQRPPGRIDNPTPRLLP
jgi:arylsulfatase A-like enzyme